LRQLGCLPRLQQSRQKWLIAFDQACFARRCTQLPQLDQQLIRLGCFLLQPLDELQTPHKPKALSLDLRWTGPAPMLSIEAANPRLMKLSRFTQEPLRR
jgi:hypothetical protein